MRNTQENWQKLTVHRKPKPETYCYVALIHQHESDVVVQEHLDELAFLTETLGAKAIHRFTQKMEKPDARTFVGSGKLEEIKSYIEYFGVDMAIFDEDLSPSQVKILENELKIKVYDRSMLILDIFLSRAKTAQAKTQVELAPVPVPVAQTYPDVDAPGKAKGRDGNPWWCRREGNRNR